jgi:hypothetical protein
MIRRSTLLAAALVIATSGAGPLTAQTSPPGQGGDALRRQVERRFDPLPLRDGIALRPKTPVTGVRSVEVTGGTIAVDGTPVTGAELRSRLGADADLVIQLSYLDAAALRTMFGGTPAATPGPAVASAAPAPPPAVSPTVPAPSFPDSSSRDRSDRIGRRRSDDRVRFGESLTVGRDEVVDGDVAAIGGSAHIEGTVHGDVVAVGGSIDLGPYAVVDGDVAVVGGSLRRAEGSRINGQIKQIGIGSFSGDWLGPQNWVRGWWGSQLGSTFALVATLTRGAVVSLLAALIILLAGRYVDRVGGRAVAAPLKAGAIGFLAQVLFLPLLVITVLVLVVTLVGIPLLLLLPFAILGLAVVALVGFTAVAERVGQYVSQRFGWAQPSVYVTTFAGIGAILSPVLLARLALAAGGTGVSLLWHMLALCGLAVEYLAWTVGFGAVVLMRFGKSGPDAAAPPVVQT